MIERFWARVFASKCIYSVSLFLGSRDFAAINVTILWRKEFCLMRYFASKDVWLGLRTRIEPLYRKGFLLRNQSTNISTLDGVSLRRSNYSPPMQSSETVSRIILYYRILNQCRRAVGLMSSVGDGRLVLITGRRLAISSTIYIYRLTYYSKQLGLLFLLKMTAYRNNNYKYHITQII